MKRGHGNHRLIQYISEFYKEKYKDHDWGTGDLPFYSDF